LLIFTTAAAAAVAVNVVEHWLAVYSSRQPDGVEH
jgi:hypothetical protein